MSSLGTEVECKLQLRCVSFCNLFHDKCAEQHVLPQRVKSNSSVFKLGQGLVDQLENKNYLRARDLG